MAIHMIELKEIGVTRHVALVSKDMGDGSDVYGVLVAEGEHSILIDCAYRTSAEELFRSITDNWIG